MATPGVLPPTPTHVGSLTAGPLDGLVADGRAIGVRTVLDLTASTPSHLDDPPPIVLVPDTLADLMNGFPTYGS